ncbi:HAD-superfamily subfamily IIID h, partial [Martensiomyces pterosporus]
ISLEVTWQGTKKYSLRVSKYATVLSVKALIEELTEVDAGSQKLLGLVKGQLPRDTDTLAALCVASGTKVRLIGTRVADRLKPRESAWSSSEPDGEDIGISDAGDYDAADSDNRSSGSSRDKGKIQVISSDHKEKLRRIIEGSEIRIINPPRPGKKLVVLDLDYTLFDCKNVSGNVLDMARPGLHEFLSAIHPYYDIIVWSQTKWHIVEAKITLLGMLTHPNYHITAALDISTMFTVTAIRNGKQIQHQVKALEYIWAKFPESYSKSNTIHIDDLSRNFALNWQNGLKITPFKRADANPRRDTELYKLARYLLQISQLPSLESLDHRRWQSY